MRMKTPQPPLSLPLLSRQPRQRRETVVVRASAAEPWAQQQQDWERRRPQDGNAASKRCDLLCFAPPPLLLLPTSCPTRRRRRRRLGEPPQLQSPHGRGRPPAASSARSLRRTGSRENEKKSGESDPSDVSTITFEEKRSKKKREKEQKEKLRHLFPRAHCKMRSSSSMRKAAHRDGSNVVARSTRADKAATAAAPRASPRQIVHVIDEETSFEAPFASRRSSLLAASGALISTLAVSAFSAGPAEALG